MRLRRSVGGTGARRTAAVEATVEAGREMGGRGACYNPWVRLMKDDGSSHKELGIRKLKDCREWACGGFVGSHSQKVGNFVSSNAAVARNSLKRDILSFVLKLYYISRN